MENNNGQTRKKALCFLSGVCALLLTLSLVNGARARAYRAQLVKTETGALSQLCAQLDTIETALRKGGYATSAPMLQSLHDTLQNAAAGAKQSLSLLTADDAEAAPVYRFLSQVGDFTGALSRRAQSGKPLTANQKQSLRGLLQYAASLDASLAGIRRGLDDDTVRFDRMLTSLRQKDGPQGFDSALRDMADNLTDYPALTYTGKYADARQQGAAKALEGKDEISIQAAKSRAAKFLSCEEKELVRESDEDSALGLYCFSRGGKTVGLTKRGGLLCYLTNPNYAGKSEISPDAAIKAAQHFLIDTGYENMKDAGYSTYDGICTIRFVPREKGVTYYADEIKVSVALDTATVVAADARGYLTHHTARSLPEKKVTLETAVGNLADELDLLDYKTAVILLDDGTEALCHELHCRDKDGQEVLVYADTQEEKEADLRLLFTADDGTLAK